MWKMMKNDPFLSHFIRVAPTREEDLKLICRVNYEDL